MDRDNAKPAAGDPALERLRGPKIAIALAGASGRPLQAAGFLRPVIALSEGALRGRAGTYVVTEQQPDGRLAPIVPSALNAIDQERLDLAVIERAFAVAEPMAPGGRPPLLVLPLSWSSVRNSRIRRKLLRAAAEGQVRLRNLPVCEITGIESGTPQAALREAAGQLQPIFRGVLARATPNRRVIRDLTDCGFTGATVEAAALGDIEDGPAMLRTVLALQKIGPGVLVHAVRSVAGLTAVRAAGASWASLDIVPGAAESAGLAAHTKTAAGETPTAA
ncbi:MAG: hypothetical protein HY859_17570 [Caulobacterales bacterium]|nr:hypothetical protein [Caulobacterales bacterium]